MFFAEEGDGGVRMLSRAAYRVSKRVQHRSNREPRPGLKEKQGNRVREEQRDLYARISLVERRYPEMICLHS